MNPIIEKVARAMRQTKVRPDQMYEDVARAAIRATLEYYAENVSEGMVESAHDRFLASSKGDGYGNVTDFEINSSLVSAIFSQAIAELDA